MANQGTKHGFSYVNVLNKEMLEKAKQSVFYVLKTTGVTVKEAQMRKTLKEYGCDVNDGMERVYMSKEVINRALSTCPKGFEGKAREEKNNIVFKPNKTTYFMNACGTKFSHETTGEFYEPDRKEFYDYLRLLDALPNIDIQNCFPLFGFKKVPDCMKLLESAAAKFRVSTKVQIEGTLLDNYIFSTQMAKEVGADLFQIVNSAAPLTYFEETSEQIRAYAKANLPFHFASGHTRGVTSPMSAVGAVIVNNAEALAGIVMAQSVCPGAKVWLNSMMLTPDMSTCKPAFGDIGNSVTDMIFNQLWRDLSLPCWSNAAAWTSSKVVDYQAGYETVMALMAQVMSGATAISFQGGMYAEISVNQVKAVIDDDIVGMVKRLISGPNLSQEAFAQELIEETGPIPGSYINSDMTLMNWREECYIPLVANRQSHEEWAKNNKQTIFNAAQQRLEDLVANHKIQMLEPQKESAVEGILQEARNHYRNKGIITDDEWKIYMEDLQSPNYPFG